MGYFDVALCFFSSFSALKCPVYRQDFFIVVLIVGLEICFLDYAVDWRTL